MLFISKLTSGHWNKNFPALFSQLFCWHQLGKDIPFVPGTNPIKLISWIRAQRRELNPAPAAAVGSVALCWGSLLYSFRDQRGSVETLRRTCILCGFWKAEDNCLSTLHTGIKQIPGQRKRVTGLPGHTSLPGTVQILLVPRWDNLCKPY